MKKLIVSDHAESESGANKLMKEVYDWTNQCVQCGYCLPACPTYETMGKESASPRGRINLVKMAAEGKIDIHEHLAEPIDLCLGCRACEVACPVGVPYGHMLEVTKTIIAETKATHKRDMGSLVKKVTLNHLFPYPKRLRAVGHMTGLYQKIGPLNKLVKKTKVMEKISEPLGQMANILPPIEASSKRVKHGKVYPSKGDKKVRVALFTGCITEAMMSRINRLTVELLTLVGCEVVIPQQQQCCGALYAHQGEMKRAKELAKVNIQGFHSSGADYYINNAGGCGASLIEYNHLLDDEPDWKILAEDFVRKSKDISQILFQYGPLPFKKEWNGVVVYQDSCHLRNVQKVFIEPRKLLQSIPGATYVEMEGGDRCCASGGIYNLLHFEESMTILDDKMEKVKQTQANVIITTNPGCYLQMSLGIERAKSSANMKCLHIVEILAEACELS